MTISDCAFDNERELQEWTYANQQLFFGESILLPGFRITTPSGKHGIPDGFAFNLTQRAWWVIECELLAHGVWPHIAEQITRYVVAARNPSTMRQVRDKLFEHLMQHGQQDAAAQALGTDGHRLLQQLELFIEGVSPSIALFIDDTNQDMLDFCAALNSTSQVYRINKFIVNGRAEYYSPDRNLPTITFDNDEERQEGSLFFDVIEDLGGGEIVSSRNKCYRLTDGRVVKLQYSKFYERHQAFWYGINPQSFDRARQLGLTHCGFIMGDAGYVLLPLEVLDRYIATAYVTRNSDESVRHYHLHISPPPDVFLKGYGNADNVDVREFYRTLE